MIRPYFEYEHTSVSEAMNAHDETSALPPFPYFLKDSPNMSAVNWRNIPERFRCILTSYAEYKGSNVEVVRCIPYEEKVLKITSCKGSEIIHKNALKECEIMQKLQGLTGVIGIHDYEEDEEKGLVFLLEEKSTCLGKYLAKNYIDLIEVPRIGVGICDALTQCLKNGIYHLDVSVNNCYYEMGEVKVGDFNCAVYENELGAIDHRIGTIKYMAPESYNSNKYDERSMVYSVGMIIYTMLNGGLAAFCPCPKSEDPVKRRMNGDALPVPQHVRKYPKDLEDLGKCALKACSFDPEDRYQTLKELRTALAEAGFDIYRRSPGIRISARYGDKDATVLSTDPVYHTLSEHSLRRLNSDEELTDCHM